MPDEIDPEELERRLNRFREEESKPAAAPRPAAPRPAPPRPAAPRPAAPAPPRPVPRPVPPAPGSSIPGRPMPMPRRTNPLAEEVRKRKKMEADREKRRKMEAKLPRLPGQLGFKVTERRIFEEEDLDTLIRKEREHLKTLKEIVERPGRRSSKQQEKGIVEAEIKRTSEMIEELERLKSAEEAGSRIRRSGFKSRLLPIGFALSLAASVLIGYGIRGCGEEPKPEEPTPTIQTVPQEEYASSQKRLEDALSQLSDKDKELRESRQENENHKTNAEKLSSQLSGKDKELREARQENELLRKSAPEQVASLQAKLDGLEKEKNKLEELASNSNSSVKDLKEGREKLAQGHFEVGKGFFDLKSYGKAAEHFGKSIEVRGHANDYHWQGVSYLELGNSQKYGTQKTAWKKALKPFEKAVDMRGGAYDHYLLGLVLSNLRGSFVGQEKEKACKKAIVHLEKSIADEDGWKDTGTNEPRDWITSAYSNLTLTAINLGNLLEEPHEKIREYQRATGSINKLFERGDKTYQEEFLLLLHRLIGTAGTLKDYDERIRVLRTTMSDSEGLIRIRGNTKDYILIEKNLSSIVEEAKSRSDYDLVLSTLSRFVSFREKLDVSKWVKAHKIFLPHIIELIRLRGDDGDYKLARNALENIVAKAQKDRNYKLVWETLSDFVENRKLSSYKRVKAYQVAKSGWLLSVANESDRKYVLDKFDVKSINDYYFWLGKVFCSLAGEEDNEEYKTELYVRALMASERADNAVRYPKRKLNKDEKKNLSKYAGQIKDIRGKLISRSKDWHKKAAIIAKKRGKSTPNLKTENFVVKLARDKSKQDQDLAAKCYELSIRYFGHTRAEYYELGMIYKEQGETEQAIKNLGHAARPFTRTDSAKIYACIELARIYWGEVKFYEEDVNALTKEKWPEYWKNLKGAKKYYDRTFECQISSSFKSECKEGSAKADKLLRLKTLGATRRHFQNN